MLRCTATWCVVASHWLLCDVDGCGAARVLSQPFFLIKFIKFYNVFLLKKNKNKIFYIKKPLCSTMVQKFRWVQMHAAARQVSYSAHNGGS